jgi:glycosyltransferase involved in cell wall biosynthesis
VPIIDGQGRAGARLSVCMATWNGGRFLRAQLGSILPQLAEDDEVILSDDRSTDDTLEVARSFADPRLRIVEGPAARSAPLNFENALRQARGELITLSDQDDVWLPGRAALIRERLEGRLGGVHLLSLDARLTDEAGQVTAPSLHARLKGGPGLLKNVYANTYVGCCLAFTRPLLELALPFPKRIPMHDMWLGLLAELNGTVEWVPVPLLDYRRHAATATNFRIEFIPITQIRRRINLSWNLVRRTLSRRGGNS